MRRRTAPPRIPAGQCAYCRRIGVHVRKEHPVSKSMWPGPRPVGTVTVPGCADCESRFQKDEEYFRNIVVVQCDANDPLIRALLDGPVSRGWKKRPHTIHQVTKNPVRLPRFNPERQMYEMAPAFELDWPRVERCVSKIVQGLYFHHLRHPVPVDSPVTVVHEPNVSHFPQYKRTMAKMTTQRGFGDDVFRYWFVQYERVSTVTAWRLLFYKTVPYFAVTIPETQPTGRSEA